MLTYRPELDIRRQLQRNIDTYDGICVAASLQTLCDMFDFELPLQAIASGMGLRFRNGQNGSRCALFGSLQFFACCAAGRPRREVLDLCEMWRDRAENYILPGLNDRSEVEQAVAVLQAACQYIQNWEKGRPGTGNLAVLKPRQYYEDIYADRALMFHHSPYVLEKKLTGAVTQGNEAMALEALREIGAQGEKSVLAEDPLRSAKNSIIGSIAFLSRASIQAGVDADNAFALSDAAIRQVEGMRSKAEVLASEESLLLQFIALVKERLAKSYSSVIVKALHYIDVHLDRRIRLCDVAEYAGVHPVYLSGRFKKETGLPLSGYIVLRKIQESCYFVLHTGYPIGEIAALYGFSSQGYYATTFKKIIGMSPGEYRTTGAVS